MRANFSSKTFGRAGKRKVQMESMSVYYHYDGVSLSTEPVVPVPVPVVVPVPVPVLVPVVLVV